MDIDLSTLSLHDRAAARRQGSAVEKVWRTAELATQILSYLVRERIDLIVCSTVSKYFRALALPLLVQTLDVHLPNAPRLCYLFETNPKMADSIKYIRIWDDKWTYRSSRSETDDGSIHVYNSEEERDPEWMKIAHLFDLILKSRTKEQLPLLDITIGVESISALGVMLRRHEQAAKRVSALHVMPCQMPSRPAYLGTSQQNSKVADLFRMRWRQLGLLVKEMCETSANANPPVLKRFHMDEDPSDWHAYNTGYNWWTDAEFWNCLKGTLLSTVEDLIWEPPPWTHRDFFWVENLLEPEWPHLRTFNLKFRSMDSRWQSRIDQFLSRHKHLENIEITTTTNARNITISNTFPKLKRYHIGMMTDDIMASFLCPDFPTIRDLTVCAAWSSLLRSPSTFLPQASLEKDASYKDALGLDVLRASSRVAALLVRSGVTVRHYEFDCVRSTKELRLDEWLFPVREAAEAVTCLDMRTCQTGGDYEDSDDDDTYTLRARFLPAGALPNLTELVLSWGDPEKLLSAWDSESLIAGALASLKHQKFLRHLRLEHSGGQSFPPWLNTVPEVENSDQIPPRLEYITWHSSCSSFTQRYRVMLPAQPDLATDSTGGMETRRPPFKIRLQRLPEEFGTRIDERGVWDRPQRWREGKTIFDHSKSPPELYV
ncbi:hypothetical protein A4X09_0g6929 [Tilletia walkeri]|uniref:Uncharacterized protein n=1 Tax=Tilletia walkeri TaxID=117179 RepID=A0A8X7T1T0_9BASI|nr:hypothetical protein A4X09_0g6929 [Tilletia walkeri]